MENVSKQRISLAVVMCCAGAVFGVWFSNAAGVRVDNENASLFGAFFGAIAGVVGAAWLWWHQESNAARKARAVVRALTQGLMDILARIFDYSDGTSVEKAAKVEPEINVLKARIPQVEKALERVLEDIHRFDGTQVLAYFALSAKISELLADAKASSDGGVNAFRFAARTQGYRAELNAFLLQFRD